jgi:hypothetical protein
MIALATMKTVRLGSMHESIKLERIAGRPLTPEEDSIGDPEDQDDEIDDLLPADLWFRTTGITIRGARTE